MTGNDEQDVLELLAVNERMGVALAYAYRKFPELKRELRAYLADYPFEWQR